MNKSHHKRGHSLFWIVNVLWMMTEELDQLSWKQGKWIQ
jgi:hypothetical protein